MLRHQRAHWRTLRHAGRLVRGGRPERPLAQDTCRNGCVSGDPMQPQVAFFDAPVFGVCIANVKALMSA